ncbi:glutamine amidotransferase [Fusarium beomiforme]|uniref:Glutamine amidotransferase n=1 Tax=Fusarium beomiforme TaxID=44412 RepID=A0A9P5A7D2_9HYPO|nr:glutamine amidotransferase [Fusarium beomiforme]
MCRFLDTRRGQNNADGFGIGFYTDPKLGSAPCLFTSTIPAWNCTNLQRIASKTASRLIFGHVRATTEGSLSEDNCHPFTHGSLMWMHNGGLGGWKYIKRRLGERLADKWYLGVKGGTDSEWAFALFLDTLERLGHDPSACPEFGFGPTILREAMKRTIAQINEMTDAIPESTLQNEDVDTRSLLNFAVTDGHSVICTRYISSSKDEAASLYYSSGTQWTTRTQSANDKQYQMERKDRGADIVLVASEPLTFERGMQNVRDIKEKQTVMVHPIIDKYYERDPHHVRSSAFVQAKGLTSNEKNRSDVASPSGVDRQQQELEGYRKMMAGTLSFGPPRSLSPDMCRQTRKVAPVCESIPVPQPQAQPQPTQTAPPSEQSNKPAPAQGNIKVKRRSVQLLDGNQGQSSNDYDQISDTDEPTRADELCPPSSQKVIVTASYLWLCEDCHERESNKELEERYNKWAGLKREIPPQYPREQQSMLYLVLQNREFLDDVFHDNARAMKIEEIQWVAEWTYEYGLMLYDVLSSLKTSRMKLTGQSVFAEHHYDRNLSFKLPKPRLPQPPLFSEKEKTPETKDNIESGGAVYHVQDGEWDN